MVSRHLLWRCFLGLSALVFIGGIFLLHNRNQLNYEDDFGDVLIDGTRLCPNTSPWLVGQVEIDLGEPSLEDVQRRLNSTGIKAGGTHRPIQCHSRHKVAVIIPFRDRDQQLPVLLNHLHPILQRQQLDYTIYLVEQTNGCAFNRGMLMNIGFMESLKTGQFYQCFIFHDIDLLPENDFNVYSCPEDGEVRQLAVSMNTFKYRSMWKDYLGGVTAMTTGDFARINGYSNSFWGWGGEDDDLHRRVVYHGLKVVRPSDSIGRYTMQPHQESERNPDRFQIMANQTRLRSRYDGLTDLAYQKVNFQLKPLYTYILVDIKRLIKS